MIFTKLAVAAGVVLLGFLCWLALLGMSAVGEGLVTVVALVLLVAGGNLLAGRGPYGARRARAAELEPRRLPGTAPAGPPAAAPESPGDADR